MILLEPAPDPSKRSAAFGPSEILRALLGYAPVPPITLNQGDSLRVLQESDRARIVGVLHREVRSGTVDLAAPTRLALESRVREILVQNLRIEHAALRVVDTFEQAGIGFRVLKGLATAFLDYEQPAMRQYGDADILVDPTQLTSAVGALRDRGHALKWPIPRNNWAATHAVCIDVDGVEVDIHSRLLHGGPGHLLARRIDLLAGGQEYRMDGRAVVALTGPLRLLQAASQNVLADGPAARFSSYADVLRLLAHYDEAAEMCGPIGLGWLLDEGVSRAATAARMKPLAPIPRCWRDRVVRWAYADSETTQPKAIRAELILAPPNHSFRQYAAVLFPGSTYLDHRGRGQAGQLARQLKRLFHAEKVGQPRRRADRSDLR